MLMLVIIPLSPLPYPLLPSLLSSVFFFSPSSPFSPPPKQEAVWGDEPPI